MLAAFAKSSRGPSLRGQKAVECHSFDENGLRPGFLLPMALNEPNGAKRGIRGMTS